MAARLGGSAEPRQTSWRSSNDWLTCAPFELDPKITERVSEWRFRQLAREGAAAPAFLLDEYGPRRRRATLVAQLLELETSLSDAAVGMFVRLILGLFTKARKGIERRYQATAKEVADLMRMLSSTIDVLTEARDAKHDPFKALDSAIGWNRLLAAKPIAAELGRKADEDPLIKACERYMTVRRFAPGFLESFTFRASSDKDALLCALDLLKRLNREPHRPMPEKPPLSFLPKAWRRLVVKDGGVDRRLYEVATLAVLCRRLGFGRHLDRRNQKFSAIRPLPPGESRRAQERQGVGRAGRM